jgi:hypothetical protein
MQRRKFLIGMGSLAAGGAAAMGTGAYESLEADRNAKMKVTTDDSAYMQLKSLDQSFASTQFGKGGRTLGIKLRILNDNAVTRFGPLFQIRNNDQPSADQENYEYWITLNPGNNASGINDDGKGNRVVQFDWDDDGTWKPLNTTDNTKPTDVPELSPGTSVDVRLTVDLRNFEPDSSVSYGSGYKLLKQAIIHSEEVSNT